MHCFYYSNSIALLESYTKQHIYFHQLVEHCSIKWTLLKWGGDLHKTTTDNLLISHAAGEWIESIELWINRHDF
jgi:hypothetical protein